MSTGDLRLVAAAYNDAAAHGTSPLVAVMGALGVSKPTAHRRVAKAREMGLLDEDFDGSNSINHKAVAVASALGVSYDDLVAAVVEHAGGDLRLGVLTRRPVEAS